MALNDISKLIRSRPALIALGVVVPLIGAAIAVPTLFKSEAPPVQRAQAPRAAPVAADVAPESDPDAIPVDTGPQPHAAGDLDLSVGLRFERYPEGSTIRANVELLNMSLESFFLPAPSEPQPTLTILVLDDEGHTVRRVVEGTADESPRRMRQLESGETARFRIDVVAPDEEPLPPGTYHLVASYESHDAWRRSGLPVWTAPQGTRHSDRVTLEVTPSK